MLTKFIEKKKSLQKATETTFQRDFVLTDETSNYFLFTVINGAVIFHTQLRDNT